MPDILKLFNGATEEQVTGIGTRFTIDWEDLAPTIEKSVMLRDDEVIQGFIIHEGGITVSIGRKPGRKRNKHA